MKKQLTIALCALTFTLHAQLVQPEWSKNAVMYEINVRQYSTEGSLRNVYEDLDRLQKLGVTVLWFMPLHPIGIEKRKGTMGSYYSVQNYHEIDPQYGSRELFKKLVQEAHNRGIKVLVDWVANHTSWDHPWVAEHPDWYQQNEKGEIKTPFDWTDVAQLDYSNEDLQKAMSIEMNNWIKEFNIDGFRCDVAFLVPLSFWEKLRDVIGPDKYLLAEMEWNTELTKNPNTYFTKAFNAAYGWNFMGVTQEMAKGKKSLETFRVEMNQNYQRFPLYTQKLLFITNHDENSWNGTVNEKYGEAWQLYSALTFTLPQSLPLIYTGEEVGLKRRLQFFEKDPITINEWGDTSRYEWYRTMTALKRTNKALWNNSNSSYDRLSFKEESANKQVYAFSRKNGKNKVTVIINIGKEKVVATPQGWKLQKGKRIYNIPMQLNKQGQLELPAQSVQIIHQ